MALAMKVKKGDLVQVLSGKDRGKQCRVIEARPDERRVIVENLNVVKRHTKPRPMRDSNRMGGTTMMPGGVIDKPSPLAVSKVMVVCDAKTEAKALDSAMDELSTIAGQRAQMRRARKSIAAFKLREGMPIGARVTLRGARMYEFLDRLVSIALPRIRDFRGLDPGSFDGRGNYSLGVREQIIFPEINYDDIQQVRGLDVAITTTAKSDDQALALLRGLGMPFAADGREQE